MLFGSPDRGVQWMIVFLGNPGPQYEATRHNVGFRVGDAVAKSCGADIRRLKNRALTAKCTLGGKEVLLVKPQTYMNLSGEAVRPLADFYKLQPGQILVVSDEVALPPGRIRLRPDGSAGGHNGLKNIIACLSTDQFPRLRVGVGAPPHPDYAMMDWVLGTIHGEDAKLVDQAVLRAAEAVECCVREGVDKAMNKYNGSV